MSLITDTGKFTSKLDLAMGTAIASATTPDINAATGNTIIITGTTTITGFTAADQAGIGRELIFNDSLLLTHGSNLKLFGNANITTVAGDIAVFKATTTTVWEMVGFFRPSGYTNGQFDSDAISNGAITASKIGDGAVIPSKLPVKECITLSDADATLTSANLVTSGIMKITPTASRNLTSPAAANIINLLTGYQTGTSCEFTIINLDAFDVVLLPGTGVTIVGNDTLNNESGTFIINVTSPTTVTIYRK